MTATFDDLNVDCLVNILSFLTREQMDDVTLLSQRLAEARNHATLDQTRTATIVCKSTCILRVFETIARQGWAASVFHPNSNKKFLNIMGIERLQDFHLANQQTGIDVQSVTRFVAAWPNDQNPREQFPTSIIDDFMTILPNLQELDVRNSDSAAIIGVLCHRCPNLVRLKWIGGCFSVRLPDTPVNLSQISLDDSRISSHIEEFHVDMTHEENYLFKQCPRLERLSITNVGYNVDPLHQQLRRRLISSSWYAAIQNSYT